MAEAVTLAVSHREPTDLIPEQLRVDLAKFLLDKHSGLLQVNIQEGRISGYRVERVVHLKAGQPRG